MYLTEETLKEWGLGKLWPSLWDDLYRSTNSIRDVDNLREKGMDPLSIAQTRIEYITSVISQKYSKRAEFILKDSSPQTMYFLSKFEKNIFNYLKEMHGVKQEDIPLLIEYGNCREMYTRNMRLLVDTIKKERSEEYGHSLPTALELIDSTGPTHNSMDWLSTMVEAILQKRNRAS